MNWGGTTLDSKCTFEGRVRGKGPARTATSLVFDGNHLSSSMVIDGHGGMLQSSAIVGLVEFEASATLLLDCFLVNAETHVQ